MRQRDGLPSRGRLADHVKTFLLEDRSEPLAHHRMIIGKKDLHDAPSLL
jgi:hypothetical protein